MPRKATSKAQYRFMQGIAHGSIKGTGMAPEKAAEYVADQSPKGLPEKVSKKGKKKVHSWAKNVKE